MIKKSKISYLGIEYLLNRLSKEQFLSKSLQSNYYRSHPVSQSRLEQFKRYKNKFLEKQKQKEAELNERLEAVRKEKKQLEKDLEAATANAAQNSSPTNDTAAANMIIEKNFFIFFIFIGF